MTSAGLRLEYVPVADWPCLAWLAETRPGIDVVTVFHGPRVEARPGWFCEATWAGPYDEGGFDRTDIVAGSGGRVREGRVTFVSAGNTVDRLHSIETAGVVRVSNSLACLMAAAGARVDPASSRYFWVFRTIVGGIARYRRRLDPSMEVTSGSAH